MAGHKPCRVQTHACSRSIQLRNEPQTLCLHQKKYARQLGVSWLPVAKEEGLPGRHQMLGGTGIAGICWVFGAGIAATYIVSGISVERCRRANKERPQMSDFEAAQDIVR